MFKILLQYTVLPVLNSVQKLREKDRSEWSGVTAWKTSMKWWKIHTLTFDAIELTMVDCISPFFGSTLRFCNVHKCLAKRKRKTPNSKTEKSHRWKWEQWHWEVENASSDNRRRFLVLHFCTQSCRERAYKEATNGIVLWFLQMQAHKHKSNWADHLLFVINSHRIQCWPIRYTCYCAIWYAYWIFVDWAWELSERQRGSNPIECDRKISRKNIFLSSNKFCFLSSLSRIAHAHSIDFLPNLSHIYILNRALGVYETYI